MSERIHVAVELGNRTVPVGLLHVDTGRTLSSTFSYDTGYQAGQGAYSLDPALPLDSAAHHVHGLPGAFTDAAPDRWGRNLIRRGFLAETAGRANRRQLTDLDFLLGVSDLTRQGCLRFGRGPEGPYLAEHSDVPKLVSLPSLMRSAQRVARDEADSDDIKVLLDAGSGSLGGARPKASVQDDDGTLFIAKFPHPADEWDMMAWEATALDLAERLGLLVPRRRLLRLPQGAVLLLERFDRIGQRRLGYLSAMSLLQARDGEQHDYIDLAEELALTSSSAANDLKELWLRVLLSVAINNTDDHLRNHGFLRQGSGWRLSPAFDINPNPYVADRQTSLGGEVARAGSGNNLTKFADSFGVTATAAEIAQHELQQALGGWQRIATANGISASEIARFKPAIDPSPLDHAVRT